MLSRSAGLAFMLLTACASTAPNTLAAAAMNTALAAGVAAGSVTSGGCYAMCTNGTTCNPRTGLCDRTGTDISIQPATRASNQVTVQLQQQANAASGSAAPGKPILGISPATGSVPPPPAEASPRRP